MRKSLDVFQPERALVREAPLKRIMAAKRNYSLTRWREDRRLQDLAKLRFASGCQLLDEEGASGENIQLTNFDNLLDDHRHPPRDSDAAKFRGVYRDSWEMLWMTAIHMKAGCEFMLMGVD